MNVHSGAVCWICLDGGVDDMGKPIVRDCACRGSDAGFAHASCIIKYAKQKSEHAVDLNFSPSHGKIVPTVTRVIRATSRFN